jgi:hypothetical protein
LAQIKQVGDLQIDQDLEFQRRMWRMQRVGWVIMGLIILAGLLGFLGGGPISRAEVGDRAGSLLIRYDRFERTLSPATLRLAVAPGTTTEGQARIKLQYPFLNKIEVQDVQPQPQSVEATSDGLVYVFSVGNVRGPVEITFRYRPEQMGLVSGGVGIEDGELVMLSQFVYP